MRKFSVLSVFVREQNQKVNYERVRSTEKQTVFLNAFNHLSPVAANDTLFITKGNFVIHQVYSKHNRKLQL